MAPFDERLFSLKIQEASKWLHSETEARLREVDANQKRIGQAFAAPWLVKRADVSLQVLREYIELVDKACRQTWLAGNHGITPDFIRTILAVDVLRVVEARTASLRGELDLLGKRMSVSGNDMTPMHHHIIFKRNQLRADAATRYEIEATELEKSQALRSLKSAERVTDLIAKGEGAGLEFKSSARWDVKENKLNKALEQAVVKTVAGFLNAEAGGTLLLGVNDEVNVLGLDPDYKTLKQRPNRDGFENWLITRLLHEFGQDSSLLIRITFHVIDGKDVCEVGLKPSPKPVFVKDERGDEHLCVRAGNSTRQLTTPEAFKYYKQRWP